MQRARFLDQLDRCLARSMRQELEGPVALFLAEADAFELMCGWFGFREVSGLLQQAGLRIDARVQNLAAATGTPCVFQHVGHSGFAIAVFGELARDATALARQLHADLRGPWHVGGDLREIPFSVGCTVQDAVVDADSLYSLARSALQQAATQATGTEISTSAELVRHERARILGRSLKSALERNELRLEYQPMFDLEHMLPRGIEALVRWEHPVLGHVSPAEFIPVAARAGFLGELGRWVLRTACAEFARLKRSARFAGLEFLSVNVSRQNVADSGLPEAVTAAIGAAAMSPSQLLLEITESELAANPARLSRTLQALRGQGVRIAIDDFGVGYSSLACLHELPVDVLKLDRSFLGANVTGPKQRDLIAIAHAVVNMARSVNLEVVAEGVETADQLTLLRALRCDLAQGYALCRPVPSAALADCCDEVAATT
jgi:EAL domain-containing protein (putative c-di-GMP-specific phosphodiesterase class I)/GGDEF domain-containing protein